MSKFKTMNNQIPGLIRHCSPIRTRSLKGVATLMRGELVLHKCGVYSTYNIQESQEPLWTLDLRDPTGAFHAAKFIDDHFAELKPHGVEIGHDFDTVLGDGTADPMARGLYYVAYSHASDGKPLTAEERKALTRIVLWVAERMG